MTQRPIHLRNSLRLAKVGLSLHRASYGAYSSMCSLRDCYFVHAALFPCQAFMDLSPLGLYLYAALFLPFGALNMPKQFLRLLGSMNRKERWERPSPHKILCIPFIYFLLAINLYFLSPAFQLLVQEKQFGFYLNWGSLLISCLSPFLFMWTVLFCFWASLNRSLYFSPAL